MASIRAYSTLSLSLLASLNTEKKQYMLVFASKTNEQPKALIDADSLSSFEGLYSAD